jgi:hypothetical protein
MNSLRCDLVCHVLNPWLMDCSQRKLESNLRFDDLDLNVFQMSRTSSNSTLRLLVEQRVNRNGRTVIAKLVRNL